ncbi:leucyl aminopeptidase [Candidatus Woesearchaeota archaeon]|nr:leucyl aminopeptidase [Candidatus Woesearchaeota archaeon]
MEPKIRITREINEGKCVVLPFFQDKLKLDKNTSKIDNSIGRNISKEIKNKDFKGENGEIRSIYTGKNPKYVMLLGLGEEKKFEAKKLMKTISDASRKIRSMGIESFSLYLESIKNKKVGFEEVLEKTVLSFNLGLYQYLDYKTKDLDKVKKIKDISIIVDKNDVSKAKNILSDANVLSQAVNSTRNLINTPPNVAVPEYMAKYAKNICKGTKIKCSILDEEALSKLGMNCYIAVGQASVNKPKMVVMEYQGGKGKPIVLVGKGITYDTGGINTKPATYMTTMKMDKSGACNVLSIVEACAKLKLKVNVIGIGAFAENAVAGNAYKPDDVIKSYSGITVEVLHSDAEGRMVLADALAYALKYKPKYVIDMATLTGAAIVATGYLVSPIMGTDQGLINKLIESGENSLDRLWQLPIWEEHDEILKSDIADVKHLTPEMDAGTIVAGVFLKQFVKDSKWAHLDIAATAFNKSDKGHRIKGGTGFGVLLMLDFLKNQQ